MSKKNILPITEELERIDISERVVQVYQTCDAALHESIMQSLPYRQAYSLYTYSEQAVHEPCQNVKMCAQNTRAVSLWRNLFKSGISMTK